MYRPPNGDMTVFEKFCESLLSANDKTSKNIIFTVDLNITILNYEPNIVRPLRYFSFNDLDQTC